MALSVGVSLNNVILLNAALLAYAFLLSVIFLNVVAHSGGICQFKSQFFV